MVQLAEDLLVIARSDHGELPVRREPVELAGLLEGVRRRFALRAAEHGVEIGIEDPGGRTVEADPLRLEQALGNLVDNALRHGAGTVTLRPASRERTVSSPSSGSTPMMRTRVPTASRRATAIPDSSPPPPRGTTTLAASPACSAISSPQVPWPAITSGWS